MRNLRKYFTLISLIVAGTFFQSCKETKSTIIIKIRDNVEIISNTSNNPQEGILQFPVEYFNTQESVKNIYEDSTIKLELTQEIQFLEDFVPENSEHSAYPWSFLTDNTPLIDSISPLFGNYEDISKVMNTSALNNQEQKYVFTNLFNYLRIEFDSDDSQAIENILNKYLYNASEHTDISSINGNNKIIEYYYYANGVDVSSSTPCPSGRTTGNYDFKTDMSINRDFGSGKDVKIIDFDEGVHQDPSKAWRNTESTTPERPHGNQVMGVLFGNSISSDTGLVPNAEAIVVSHLSPTITTYGQYSQFLHALSMSIDTRGASDYRILLIEVHNMVGTLTGNKGLPLETDPAMFFLIRLGTFGLKLIIPEVAGNNGSNLDAFRDTLINISGRPLSEFTSRSSLTSSGASSFLGISSLQLDGTNATQQEIDSNIKFNSRFTSTANWLPIWRSSPSGAILVAGYGKTTTPGGFSCKTNYGTKVKIMCQGENVKSFNFVSPNYCPTNFDGSSSATAILTGIIASALSKDTSKTEGDIKRALYGHTSSMPLIRGMKVPNVPNFYTYLSPPPAP